ncbi:MAG: hypothetical protein IK080_01445 [Clostridia bacterium]|nr:hypothetical protein [Clostridia bacterium]
MKRVCRIAALCLALLLCLTSCSSGALVRPVSELLKPPLYYPEYEDLVEAFHKNIGTDVDLCIPRSGDYSSAVVLEDLDMDGSKEALIFYRNETTDAMANMHYFDKLNDRWISLGNFKGYGSEVGSVQTSDLDADGIKEIIVQWSFSGVSSGDMLSVYRRDQINNSYKEIATELCALSETVDMDGDGCDELFFISPVNNGTVTQRYARLMKLSGGAGSIVGETAVDASISSYVSIKVEKPTGDLPLLLYIDAMVGEQQMITELLYWDATLSKLVAPLLDEKTLTHTQTLRNAPIECADLNRDGRLDIPTQSEVFSETPTGSSDYEEVYLTVWKTYTRDGLEDTAYTLINQEENYLIELTKNEAKTLGLRSYPRSNCWIVFQRESPDDALFSVIKIPQDRWGEEEFVSYIPIVELEDGVVSVFITQKGVRRGITEEIILSKIKKMS